MKNLLKNSGILMLGELITKMLSVLYLIPLIRINENIGILNATVTIPFSLFVVFGTLGINILLTSEITKRMDNPNRLRTCLLTALSLLTVLSVVSGVVLLIFAKPVVMHMISDPTYVNYIIIATRILSVGVILYAITAYLRTVITAFGLFTSVSLSYIIEQILKVSIILIGSFIFISYQHMDVGVYSIILSIAVVASMVVTLFYYLYQLSKHNLLHIFSKGKFRLSPKLMHHFITGGIVILAASIYANAYEMIDLMMMQNYLTTTGMSGQENDLIRGIYFTSSWKLVFIPISIAGSIITVMMTKIGGNNDNDARHFDSVFNLTLLFGVISMLLLLLLGERAYNFLYGSASLGIIMYQAFLIPFYVTRNILGTYVVSAGGKKGSVIISIIMMLVVKICGNLICFNIFGYIGVVASSIISIILSMIYLYLTNPNIFKLNFKTNQVKMQVCLLGIILGIVFVFGSHVFPLHGIISIVILFIAAIIIMAICFKKPFMTMVELSKESEV